LPAKRLPKEAADVLTHRSVLVADLMAPSQQKHWQFRPHLLREVMKLKAARFDWYS